MSHQVKFDEHVNPPESSQGACGQHRPVPQLVMIVFSKDSNPGRALTGIEDV
jgi:hypothetical protein